MLRIPKIIYNNKFNLPSLPPPGSFKDQTILITGGNSGLGLATAVHFINLGASTVIITTRHATKGEAAKASTEAQTNTTGKVKVMELDMSTFASVKDFADRVKQEVKSIDYVLLNAGLLNNAGRVSPDGFEETLQVNVLSTALLALLLLPWLKSAGRGKAHLGIVGSGVHRGVDISAGNGWPQEDVVKYWNEKENWQKKGGQGMYGVSKLLVQYCMGEIAKLAKGEDGEPEVIVNAMCPGMVKSELGRDYRTSYLMSLGIDTFMNLATKSTEGGARTLALAATTTPEENGKYITHYQSHEDYQKATEKNVFGPEGQKMQAQVWKEILAILEDKVPQVKEVVSSSATA